MNYFKKGVWGNTLPDVEEWSEESKKISISFPEVDLDYSEYANDLEHRFSYLLSSSVYRFADWERVDFLLVVAKSSMHKKGLGVSFQYDKKYSSPCIRVTPGVVELDSKLNILIQLKFMEENLYIE